MVDTGNTYGDRVSRLVSWGHWFAFINIIFAMMIGVRFVTLSPWPETLLGQFYLFVSWLGHFGFLVFALYILLVFPLSFVIPSQKLFRLVSVIFATLGLTLLILDSQAYQALHLHLNPVVWELLLSGEKTSFNAQWQHLFTLMPIIFILELVFSELIWKKQRKLARKKIGKPAAIIFFICFLTSHLIYVWADANYYAPITSQRSNFPLSYPMTAKTFMQKHGLIDREAYEARLEHGDGGAEMIDYPLEPLTFDGKGKHYNVLIVMADNLRADMLTPSIMPNTYNFAQQNQNFTNHYSSSNDDYGVFGLFYGLPTNYANSIEKQNSAPLFLAVMKDKGYQMSAFSDANFQQNEFFGAMFKELDVTTDGSDSDAPAALSQWQTWYQANRDNTPWMSYVEINDTDRYEDVDKILPQFETDSDKVETKLKASYQTAAWQVDQKMATILNTLEAKDALKNTIIVFTSNHGIEFNETGSNNWGSSSNFSRYQLQVPMVIHWPNKAAKRYPYKTSHLDFSATMMQDLLESSSNPYDYSSGQNLFANQKRDWILSGDRDDIALITDKNTTVVDEYGNYKVYDENYKRDKDSKPRLSIVMQGLSELKRFYND
ncbi:MAG: DUF3413 domain-containing protein [Vibrio sp.]